jgi:hypothetical protein
MQHYLRMHRAKEELILILAAHPARVREPEHIELVIAWPLVGGGRGGGQGRAEIHHISTQQDSISMVFPTSDRKDQRQEPRA